jgi:hypothetical protein
MLSKFKNCKVFVKIQNVNKINTTNLQIRKYDKKIIGSDDSMTQYNENELLWDYEKYHSKNSSYMNQTIDLNVIMKQSMSIMKNCSEELQSPSIVKFENLKNFTRDKRVLSFKKIKFYEKYER